MWTYDEKQLKEKNLPGASIKESGCYECKIERAELFKSDVNKSEALILTFRALKEDTKIKKEWNRYLTVNI